MSRVAVIAVCLLGIVLSSCSGRIEPPPPNVTIIEDAERKMEHLGGASDENKKKKMKGKKKDGVGEQVAVIVPIEVANEVCRKESRAKGIRSLAAIFRRRSTKAAYAECMQKRGYNVEE